MAAGAAAFASEALWKLHADNAGARSSVETGVTLLALASALLLVSRFRHSRQLRDLLLLVMLATVGLTSFVFNALPAFGAQTGIYGAGARLALGVLVAGTFVVAAFTGPERSVASGRRLVKLAAPVAICWIAGAEALDLLLGPVAAHGPSGAFEPMELTVSLGTFIAFAVAAVALASRPGRDSKLLAAAAVALGASQLARVPLVVMPAGWLTPTDVLRLTAHILLLIASFNLHRASVAQRTTDAVAAERIRIARDLHDGLAQDLAFIALHSERLAAEYGAEHPVVIAARRALAASRGKIVDLEASQAPSTEAALREVAAEFSERHAVDVSVAVAGPPAEDDGRRSELVRIAREGIANAVRHGGARRVAVTLGSERRGILLRISDDGCGFAGANRRTAGTGAGLRTMHRRAQSIGAGLLTSDGGRGGAEINVVAMSDGSGWHSGPGAAGHR